MSWNTRTRWTRAERNAIFVLLLLITGMIVCKSRIIRLLVNEQPPVINHTYAALIRQIDSAKPAYYHNYTGKNKYDKSYSSHGEKKEKYVNKKWTIEINSASAQDFEKLYGIGKVLSARIVKFREGLGGFQNIEQLHDVYGIEDSTFEKIRAHLTIKPAPLQKININQAEIERLSAHPYIPPTLAKQFIGYRTKVKPFDEVEEIKKLYYLRDHPELYEKLSPYLTVN